MSGFSEFIGGFTGASKWHQTAKMPEAPLPALRAISEKMIADTFAGVKTEDSKQNEARSFSQAAAGKRAGTALESRSINSAEHRRVASENIGQLIDNAKVQSDRASRLGKIAATKKEFDTMAGILAQLKAANFASEVASLRQEQNSGLIDVAADIIELIKAVKGVSAEGFFGQGNDPTSGLGELATNYGNEIDVAR